MIYTNVKQAPEVHLPIRKKTKTPIVFCNIGQKISNKYIFIFEFMYHLTFLEIKARIKQHIPVTTCVYNKLNLLPKYFIVSIKIKRAGMSPTTLMTTKFKNISPLKFVEFNVNVYDPRQDVIQFNSSIYFSAFQNV